MALQSDAAVGDMGGDAGLVELDEKKRIIQEFVPGKQVTLAHVIANPTEDLYAKLGLIDAEGSIGIMTITPSEGAMIAADVAAKAANVADRLCRPLQRFACHHGRCGGGRGCAEGCDAGAVRHDGFFSRAHQQDLSG